MTRRPQQTHRNFFALSGLLTTALLLTISSDAASAQSVDAFEASDDAAVVRVERKGFVIGFGLGAARVTTSASEGPLSVSFAETAVSTDFKIGYAPNDQLLLYWSADGAFRSMPALAGEDGLSFSGLGGLGATYFLKPGRNSFFVSASIGRSSEAAFGSDGQTASANGSGFAIGGGYEFSGHWLLDADIVMNSFTEAGLGGYDQRIIRVGLSWLHY